MLEPKTKLNTASALKFVKSISNDQMRTDSLALLKLFEEATGEKSKMWGSAIIGYGTYATPAVKNKAQTLWPLVGFSPRKQALTLYLLTNHTDLKSLYDQLGKYKTSAACLYIKKLTDVNTKILVQIVKKSYKLTKAKHSKIIQKKAG